MFLGGGCYYLSSVALELLYSHDLRMLHVLIFVSQIIYLMFCFVQNMKKSTFLNVK